MGNETEKSSEMNVEKVGEVLVGQEHSFEVGGQTLVLRPRTLAQLIVISKVIVRYSDKIFLGIQAMKDDSNDEEKEIDNFLKIPLEHIAILLQMFLDEERVFKKQKATVSLKFILEEIDFTMITEISTAALEMHNVGDILKNLNGLRVN